MKETCPTICGHTNRLLGCSLWGGLPLAVEFGWFCGLWGGERDEVDIGFEEICAEPFLCEFFFWFSGTSKQRSCLFYAMEVSERDLWMELMEAIAEPVRFSLLLDHITHTRFSRSIQDETRGRLAGRRQRVMVDMGGHWT